jgi:AGZA family xanthine/uracil permease-like MFS transporter
VSTSSHATPDSTESPTPPAGSGFKDRLDRYFEVTKRGSTFGQETRGGLTTFFTMAYIVVLNPLIIGLAPDVNGNTLGMPQVAAATCLVAAVLTFLMGVVGKFPLALATGLGLNAFLAFGVASQMTWAEAMGLVVLEGILITLLVLTGFRTAVFRAIPRELKAAIAVGIGLFIALIGLVDGGLVRRIPDVAGTTVPVQMGTDGTLHGWPITVFVLGLLLTAAFVARKVKGGILLGLLATTAIAVVVELIAKPGPSFVDGKPVPTGWSLNVPTLPEKIIAVPDLSLLGNVDLFGGFGRIGVLAAVLLVFTLMLADFFDTMGTVTAIAAEGDLTDTDGEIPNVERILLVDSLAAVAGGAASVSSNTSYIESAAGVGDGARTGFASLVTSALFLLGLAFTPLITLVPFEAAGPALVVVGFLMMTQIKEIDFSDYSVAIPAFLTMVLMPFTYSITIGIGAGVISYVVLQAVAGKVKGVHPLLWTVAGLFVVYFAINIIKAGLGI